MYYEIKHEEVCVVPGGFVFIPSLMKIRQFAACRWWKTTYSERILSKRRLSGKVWR